MEADWSVELAADDPVILVPWAAEAEGEPGSGYRYVDLRTRPQAIDEISEARSEPALRSALLRLNSARSHLWTAKCDVWKSSGGGFDPREMDAEDDETEYGAGSYIDLLPRDTEPFSSFALQERWIRALSGGLRGGTLRRARSEFVLRRAEVEGAPGFAVTWFVESCGKTAELAARRWEEALEYALAAILRHTLPRSAEPAK